VERRGPRDGPYRVGDEDLEDIYGHQAPRDPRLETLEHDHRIRSAALIGDTFGLDPVLILEETDELKVLVRLAAHNVVQTETRKANRAP
jgi:hypothetical protein